MKLRKNMLGSLSAECLVFPEEVTDLLSFLSCPESQPHKLPLVTSYSREHPSPTLITLEYYLPGWTDSLSPGIKIAPLWRAP